MNSVIKFSKSSISQIIKKITSENLGINCREITSQSNFNEDLGADSLDTVELIIGLEEQFNIEIPDDEARKLSTVHDAIEYLFIILNKKL